LEQLLAACPVQRKLVVSDAVFSMDGNVADIEGLLALCERYDALLLLDDAHGFGVLGPQGRGSLAAAGLTGAKASPRVLYMATLSKAAGVSGAFVAGHELLIEWLLQKTRSYTFATAAPAMLARALQTSLQLIESRALCASSCRLVLPSCARVCSPCCRARAGGFAIGHGRAGTGGGRQRRCARPYGGLRRHGLWVPAIRPPTVPVGTARLRIALSALHTEADVKQLLAALQELAG
jgi:8-amino-7-oxononanoate synthase